MQESVGSFAAAAAHRGRSNGRSARKSA
jgi:hypothetical protein